MFMLAIAYLYCVYSDVWFENFSIALGAAFLIPSLFATQSIVSRVLSHPAIVFVGKLTFSVYMFHVLVFFFVKLLLRRFGIDYWLAVFLGGYTLTLMFAWLVYRYYEKPLIKYGKRIATNVDLPRVAKLPT